MGRQAGSYRRHTISNLSDRYQDRTLTTPIDEGDNTASLALAMDVAGYFCQRPMEQI